MRILVTNDDGINAPGLKICEEIARALSDDVWIVAPEFDQSGVSHSLSLNDPLRLRKLGDKMFAVKGTPTDCVHIALTGMLDALPDLVVSGINNGQNMGDDTLYSGTVAAATEAFLFGIPAIAFSQVNSGWGNLDAAARVARDVVAALPAGSLLVLGSSTPVRDVDRLAVPRPGLTVLANRGVAGIDGTLSTAIGAALAHQGAGGGPAFALMGDLTFLHDLQGLLVGDGEPVPDLTVVVPDNDGGGIFGLLEQGDPRFNQGPYAGSYERVFGTPHRTDLAALCAGFHLPHRRVGTAELSTVLAQPPVAGGIEVIEVVTDRERLRTVHARIAERLRDPRGLS